MNTTTFRLLIVWAVIATCGCEDELYHGLDERSANELVVALQGAGLDAGKTGHKGGYTVSVPDGSTAEAMRELEARGLPRPQIMGFEAFYPRDGLVTTATEERVLIQYATSQELRRALSSIDGVVDAHVNLVMPGRPSWGSKPSEPGRASVVLRWEGKTPPVSVIEVQELVAGAVAGLEPPSVAVLLTAARIRSQSLDTPRITQVGPLAVSTASKGLAQVVLFALLSLVFALGATIITAVVRRQP